MTLEEISPELFLWELYDANGIQSLSEDLHIAKSVGYCDASRLQVRPRAGMFALMIEFEDGTKHWFHGTEHTLNPGDKCTACDGADELRGMVARALSEPLRNCDVGTAEEQEVRFRNYCWNHSSRDKNMECQCPIDTEGRAGCKLEWAQMPYGSEVSE